MGNIALIMIIISYLALLFLVAFLAEKNRESKWVNNPYVYTLSLAVYCTAWTYYGSVGIASKSGIRFLAIYLGPVIAMPLWIILMRKIIRISKQQKISSIADFISMRYGNNRLLGALVTITCLIAVIPYIALQLKAVSETFELLIGDNGFYTKGILFDTTFYIALLIAIFVAFFGTRSSDASKRKQGIATAVAVESLLKLVFFLIIGIYVTFYLFDGTSDIYEHAAKTANFKQLASFGGLQEGFNWLFTICLSFFAIFLLPRQFHVAVVENQHETHLKKAIWLFPLYLLLFNVFVIFIAWAGNINFNGPVNADYYSLLLPLQKGHTTFAVMVFIGGFSAVISMIVVSTLALSTMVSNNLVIPYGFVKRMATATPESNSSSVKNLRRIAIFMLIIVAYFFYVKFSKELSLYAIGLISFVVISQLAPSFFLGLFWRRGTAKAAKIGIAVGLLIVLYTLIGPMLANTNAPPGTMHASGLFNLPYLTPESNAFFWSITGNLLCFLVVSVRSKGNYRERNYAEMFVNNSNYENLQENAFVWKGEAYVADIRQLLNRFLGESRTLRALDIFNRRYGISEKEERADARLINFSEKLLTGTLGSASAKMLLASVSKEKPVSLLEVLTILEETKETKATNKLLLEKSKELEQLTALLKSANQALLSQDKLKDEFLDTVAHELKTPITSIKAASEVLQDDDMPKALRKRFLTNIENDTKRLTTLIHNILDLEKLSNKRAELELKRGKLDATIKRAVDGVRPIANLKDIGIKLEYTRSVYAHYDEDRMLQVLTNLLSNALKFTDAGKGAIKIQMSSFGDEVRVAVEDNGKGIPKDEHRYIFQKFYQSKNQNIKKQQGSGFGLAICQKIIEGHAGRIWSDETIKTGARIVFTIPLEK
ncbi:Serine phosphatase RsbU, regulator of sigma subunit [Croceitalea dokdonensis DOKDO 023]|uniref:histidine kinase n=1 Tax=Croceitalea dokdonensis DOKDO 023 TaxID=1300341 RepID=A0A0P7AZU5_9FLAO|nr:sensor histidine kinase [Croceitalea dokdonensis]KPM33839.1 Serine phosphatase RsbU, regulator of sigma subunit [Croceitalea dokdonensis DOKDO 023]